jgi:hypothetical protein
MDPESVPKYDQRMSRQRAHAPRLTMATGNRTIVEHTVFSQRVQYTSLG